MNTIAQSKSKSRKGQISRRFLWVGGIAALALVTGGLASAWFGSDREVAYSGLTREVRRGGLTISVTESGTLRNRDQVVVSNRVEGRTTILWIIEEGQHVEEGDLLVELDSSELEDRLIDREISVQNAEANYIRAQQSLEVTKSRTRSEIAEAELELRFAKLDLEKYTGENGEYAQELDKLNSDIDIAREEMLRAQQEHEDSKELAANEFITPLELEGDRLAYQRAEVNLRLAQGRLQLMENYTHDRQLQQLESDVERATEKLERARMNAHADIVQAEADYKARAQELERQKQQRTNLKNQIALCRIEAPAAGMVVYETSANPGRRGNREPLEAGQEVRERQELIYLPASTGMTAEVQVHESALERIDVGMPARITVDARPGQHFEGRVRRIAPMPDAQSIWLNPDLTVYSTLIDVDAHNLRTGMSARAEIVVEELEDVLYIPVQSVVRHNGRYFVYVLDARGVPRHREVEIGLDNNRVVHIRSGLDVGEEVLLAPPLPDRMEDPPEQERAERPREEPPLQENAPGRGAGRGRPDSRT